MLTWWAIRITAASFGLATRGCAILSYSSRPHNLRFSDNRLLPIEDQQAASSRGERCLSPPQILKFNLSSKSSRILCDPRYVLFLAFAWDFLTRPSLVWIFSLPTSAEITDAVAAIPHASLSLGPRNPSFVSDHLNARFIRTELNALRVIRRQHCG